MGTAVSKQLRDFDNSKAVEGFIIASNDVRLPLIMQRRST